MIPYALISYHLAHLVASYSYRPWISTGTLSEKGQALFRMELHFIPYVAKLVIGELTRSGHLRRLSWTRRCTNSGSRTG